MIARFVRRYLAALLLMAGMAVVLLGADRALDLLRDHL